MNNIFNNAELVIEENTMRQLNPKLLSTGDGGAISALSCICFPDGTAGRLTCSTRVLSILSTE